MISVNEKLLAKVISLLNEKKIIIATAESCTGGLIANVLTDISGSSDYFDRGIVSYSNQAKMDLLNVPEEQLIKFGAVSEEVAASMAKGVLEKSNADIGISTTGIAGPTGGTKDKPVGLVYIGIANFEGDRLENKISTCNEALKLAIDIIGD